MVTEQDSQIGVKSFTIRLFITVCYLRAEGVFVRGADRALSSLKNREKKFVCFVIANLVQREIIQDCCGSIRDRVES